MATKNVTPKLPTVHVPGRTGRPPISDSVVQKILLNLKRGNTRQASYRSAGMSEATFYRWMTDREGFRESVERAEAEAEAIYVSRLARAARAGDVSATKFWLERRRSADWRERSTIMLDDKTPEEEVGEILNDDALRSRLLDLAREAERRAASGADGPVAVNVPDAGRGVEPT